MAKKTSGRNAGNKMAGVREILKANPNANAREISEKLKSQFSLDITPKMAATYRYHIRGKKRRKQRSQVQTVTSSNPKITDKSTGIDHLLKAAYVLGWERVKEIVDGILHAPT